MERFDESLKSSLLELEHMHAQQIGKSQYQSSNSDLPLLSGMTRLTKDDKKNSPYTAAETQ